MILIVKKIVIMIVMMITMMILMRMNKDIENDNIHKDGE